MLVPSQQLEDVYQALLDTQQAVVDALRPGNSYAQAYAAGLGVFENRQPTLKEKLTKSFGLVLSGMITELDYNIDFQVCHWRDVSRQLIAYLGEVY